MNSDKDNLHLSELEAHLFCDKELAREDMIKAEKHLEGCESCYQLVEKTRTFSNMLHRVVKSNVSSEIKLDCISDMDISAYLENKVSSNERLKIEEHLSRCEYCLSIMVESKKSLQDAIKEDEPYLLSEKIIGIVKQQLREQKGNVLLEEFSELVKNSPEAVQNSLVNIKNEVEIMIKNTFTYPSSRFTPVFGENEANVLSPFGKVRYPVVFEWLPCEGADQYIVSIEAKDWSFNTNETLIEILTNDLNLDYGSEYMWELKIMSGKKVIDEITGFFSLASKEDINELMEIEKQLKNVKTEQGNLILWGEILEEKGFYMEAIKQYKKAYGLEPLDGIAYRIAYCYDRLELEELRDWWNKLISD